MDDNVLTIWDAYRSTFLNSLFHLYDIRLERLFSDLYKALNKSTRYFQFYQPNHNASAYYFSNPGDAPLTKEQEPAWQAIENANRAMYLAIQDILKILREQYIEIDIIKTNKKAWEYINQ